MYMLYTLPCVCVCVLPRIQPDADLLQFSITDGETITCHLKEGRSRKESRQEIELLQGTGNTFHHLW